MGNFTFKRVVIAGKDISQARMYLPILSNIFNKKGFGVITAVADNLSRIFKFCEVQKPAFIFFHQDIKDNDPETFEDLKKGIKTSLHTTKIFEFQTREELITIARKQIETLEATNGIQKN